MNLRILGALLRKEIYNLKSNPLIPRLIFGLPLVVLLVIPLVATFDVRNVGVVVVDNDMSDLSRRIISDIGASEVLEIVAISQSNKKAMETIERGEADVLLSIPFDFARNMSGLDVEANGVNAIKGMLGMQYVTASIESTLRHIKQQSGAATMIPTASVVNLYNPTLSFRYYMIPALMVFLIIMICGFLPTINLVNEKETGTIEAMNVTPVGKFTFVLSKLIPFWAAGLIIVTVGIVIGMVVYGLHPVGSIGGIYLASILLSLFMSGMGVTIANKSATMLQSIFVMFAVIMIFQLMGGLFTPISSMPQWAQSITYAVPPRYFNEIMRALYLKGTSVGELWLQYTLLGSFAFLACIAAAATYKKRS